MVSEEFLTPNARTFAFLCVVTMNLNEGMNFDGNVSHVEVSLIDECFWKFVRWNQIG